MVRTRAADEPGLARRRYVEIPYPWRAAIDPSAAGPARQYAALVSETLNHRLPARRRFGLLLARLGALGLPEGPLASALRALPSRERADLDGILQEIARAWPQLGAELPSLPEATPPLTALAVRKSAGLTLFVFVDGESRPRLVAKTPLEGETGGLDREVEALRRAAGLKVAPKHLATIGAVRVQEALEGRPLRVRPVTPASAGEVRWSPQLNALAEAFRRLCESTRKAETPAELTALSMDALLESGLLSSRATRLVNAAYRDISRLGVSVLRHGDASPQNWLFDDEGFRGFVDWENMKASGVPGFDLLTGALSYLECGVGLVRWSQRRVVDAFYVAWARSSYWKEARAAFRSINEELGVRDALVEPLEITFFARRVLQRLERPGAYPTDAATAAAMVEIACAT